jgi:hypothetical protein
MKSLLTISLYFFIAVFLFSCAFAPVNTQFEKAGTLKKNNLELTGSFSSYSIVGDGGAAKTNNNVGFRVGYGISDKFDLKLRYERLMISSDLKSEDIYDGEFKGVNYISIIPKIAIIPKKLSLLIPVNHYSYKENFDSVKSHVSINSVAPQLIYTFTNAKNKFDFSLGLKADCFFGNGGGGALMGATIGAGFSSDLNKWALRPEIGVNSLAFGGCFLSYGIGLQLIIPKKKQTNSK